MKLVFDHFLAQILKRLFWVFFDLGISFRLNILGKFWYIKGRNRGRSQFLLGKLLM
jgi:hypothetical protein